jgi:hypothetical protein
MKKLEGYFDARWGELSKKSEEKFWKDFEKKTSTIAPFHKRAVR